MSAVINCAAYSNGRRIANVKITDISKFLKQEDKFVWIGLHEPDENLLSEAQQQFGLHDLAIEDAHRAHQRPKIEVYGDSLFIVLRTVQSIPGKRELLFGETHFFLGANFLVSVRHGSTLSYGDVRSRCETTPHLLHKGASFALYAVMDAIVDQYFPVVNDLEEELERLEEDVFAQKPSREIITSIYQLKRELLEVKRAISPVMEICNRLMRFDTQLIPDETRPYFRDVFDHTVRINEMVDSTRELLTSVLEVSFSLISIAQNDVSKKFAGWAAILGVPTLVAGVYGMNFSFMPELSWHFGYPFVLGSTILVCLILYWRFKRADWL
ncbi:magnesium/cobalt transporter CorA [Chitinophagaceae bacterium LB-8]|uniref:Magnesium transport protein CorA n=1 Tax=Paraflavisolibacter caeni TaxID=2982496 RepID=A0A9X2XXK2_9BACT|nr:magnesium/cobalt transporter CorA [Paraflavisolibacter caeni]MCU7550542.1 magnesium/cobalt transporter CorA [Paraflavisolibacter caeni]